MTPTDRSEHFEIAGCEHQRTLRFFSMYALKSLRVSPSMPGDTRTGRGKSGSSRCRRHMVTLDGAGSLGLSGLLAGTMVIRVEGVSDRRNLIASGFTESILDALRRD